MKQKVGLLYKKKSNFEKYPFVLDHISLSLILSSTELWDAFDLDFVSYSYIRQGSFYGPFNEGGMIIVTKSYFNVHMGM